MKIFVYLSILLFSAGAVFGFVDYVQAEKKGTLKKVYNEPPSNAAEEETPSEDSALVNEVDKSMDEKEKDIAVFSSKEKGTRINSNRKAIANRNPALPNSSKRIVKAKVKKKIVPPVPPRKINIRDFGRSSLRE